MQLLIIVIISCVIIYGLSKIGLYLYRPFALDKLIERTQNKYEKLIAIMEKDEAESIEMYKKFKSGDTVSIDFYSEDDFKKRTQAAIDAKNHEKEMRDKMIRLNERYISDINKLVEMAVNFDRYFTVSLQICMDAEYNTNSFMNDSMTFDKWTSAANESRIIKEECQRRIDAMLNS